MTNSYWRDRKDVSLRTRGLNEVNEASCMISNYLTNWRVLKWGYYVVSKKKNQYTHIIKSGSTRK